MLIWINDFTKIDYFANRIIDFFLAYFFLQFRISNKNYFIIQVTMIVLQKINPEFNRYYEIWTFTKYKYKKTMRKILVQNSNFKIPYLSNSF